MNPRTAPKPRRRKPRSSKAATEPPSKLILLGTPARLDRVEEALAGLEVDIIRTDDERLTLDAETAGIIVVAPLPTKASAAQAVRAIRTTVPGRGVPVFALVPAGTGDRTVRRIYADGATAVFEWPREAPRLGRLVAELLGIALVRGRAQKPQVALTRALRAHLRLAPWSTAGVRIKALHGGEVQVSGSVPAFWRKRELEELIAQVPGVTRVLSADLWVTPSGLTDAQIARAVRSVLRNTTTVDDATVSVAVHGGTVVLAGTVADRRELKRVLDLVANVVGVRGIMNSLVVSSSAKHEDRMTARRLNALLSSRFPGERAEAKVFASVAVLSGKVSRLSRRYEIEKLVDQASSITRVINKIDVA